MRNNLYQLIHSLSSAEKHFLSRQLATPARSRPSNYKKLYDVICDYAAESDEEVVNRLKDKKLKTNFAVIKAQLTGMILKSLRGFDELHIDNRTRIRLRIREMEVLMKKHLYEAARKHGKKALKLAEEFEYHCLQEELLLLFIQLNNKEKMYELNKRCYRQLEQVNSSRVSLVVLEEKLTEITAIHENQSFVSSGKMRKTLARLSREVEQIEPPGKHSFRFYEKYYTFYQRYYRMVLNEQKSLEYRRKLVELMDKHPYFVKEEPEGYVYARLNYVLGLLEVQAYSRAAQEVDKMSILLQDKTFTLDNFIAARLFYNLSLYELIILDKQKEYDKGYYRTKQISVKLGKYEMVPFYGNKAWLFFSMAMALIRHNDYKAGIKWLNRIMNDKKMPVSQLTLNLAKGLSLLAHFKLGNYGVVESQARSLEYYFQRSEGKQLLLKVLVWFFKTAINIRDKESYFANLKKLVRELDNIESDKNENFMLDFFNFREWAESEFEVAGTSF